MANILRDAVEGHWTLDELAGADRVDSTINGNDAIDNSFTDSVGGLLGNAAFPGAGGSSIKFLTIPHTSDLLFGDEDFTIGAWVLPSNVGQNVFVFSMWEHSTNKKSYTCQFTTQGGGKFRFGVSADGAATTILDTATTYAPAVWHQVIWVHDSVNNELRIYVDNGTPTVLSYSGGVFGTNDQLIDIGRLRGTSITVGNGRIDELAAWRRAFTAADVAEHWNGGTPLPFAQWEATPLPPDNFTAVAVGPDLIRLNWDDTLDEDNFEIQRAGDYSAGLFETRYLLPADTTTLLDGDRLVQESEYCYRIRTIVDGIPSAWSPVVCATTLEIPNPTVPMDPGEVTTDDQWGALFHMRPGPEGSAADRADIQARGFTILEESAFSGHVEVYGYGNTAAVVSVLDDTDFKLRVPSHFFKLPAGETLTLALIKQWTDVDNVVR